jgi:hypothetical protein
MTTHSHEQLEQLEDKRGTLYESADALARDLLFLSMSKPNVGTQVAALLERAQGIHAGLHELWKETRGT